MTEIPIRTQRIARFNERKCWGSLSFKHDVLSVEGWTFRGKIQQTIRLEDIDVVRPVPSRTGNNLFLQMNDGSVTALRMKKGVVYLAHTVNDVLGQFRLEKKTLPGSVEYRRAV